MTPYTNSLAAIKRAIAETCTVYLRVLIWKDLHAQSGMVFPPPSSRKVPNRGIFLHGWGWLILSHLWPENSNL